MKFVPGSTIISLNPGETALVFRLTDAEAHTERTLESKTTATEPEQMLAVAASLLGKDNRDLWHELLARADFKMKERAKCDSPPESPSNTSAPVQGISVTGFKSG